MEKDIKEMSTLQTQYKKYLEENPDKPLSYVEWFSKWIELNGLPIEFDLLVSDDFQIGPDGAFEYEDQELEDLDDWDSTLMDGLDDEDWDD